MASPIAFIFLMIFCLSSCVDQLAAPIEQGDKIDTGSEIVNTPDYSSPSPIEHEEGIIIRKNIDENNEMSKVSGKLEDEKSEVVLQTDEDNNKTFYYEVQEDETLESIAESYNKTTEELAILNNLTHPYHIEYGQIIKIKVNNKLLNTKNTAGDFNFIKPVEGEVIIPFGTTTKHGKSKGVDIAAKEGAKVSSISAGTVIFSGNEKQFGNLIIVKLDTRDLYAAYANLKDLILSKGDVVAKGDIIGHVGRNSQTKNAQLHFAIRKGKEAVDPTKYVPLD
jgi:murein DD-endopeptidase MepM/ murein hydrolase activator NlpD